MIILICSTGIGLIVDPGELRYDIIYNNNYYSYFFFFLKFSYKKLLFQITLVLLAHKIAYPRSVHLLRGNHESLMCTKEYGFKNEVYYIYIYI